MKNNLGLFLCSASIGCMAIAAPATAQQAQPAAETVDQPVEAENADIVVTANKREQNLNDVGLSITAVSGEALAQRKISSLEDIASIVPGLSYSASTTNTPIYTLRGVGFNESSLGVYPAVSVYVDQAPLPFPVLASHSAYDLERIEVLKGPQGTLFGQNSTGGAINYIAAKPTNSFEAGGDISYGRFNAIDGNAYVSGPLSENVRARLALTGANSDGWQYSVTRPNDRNGATSYVAGRLLLDADVTEAIKLSFNVNGWVDKSEPQAQQLIGIRTGGPQGATAVKLAATSVFAPDNARAADWSTFLTDPATGVQNADGTFVPGTATATDFTPRANRKFYQLAMRADIELGSEITLTSLTSYSNYDQKQATDGDGNAAVTFDLQKNDGYVRSFSQELRLANDTRGAFRWVLGANYESSTTFEDQLLRYFDNSNYNPATLYINGSEVNNKQKIRNYAAFASTEYDLVEKLTLKVAARYTNSSIKDNNCGFTIPGGNVDKLFGTASPNACYTFDAAFMNGPPILQTLKEDNVSWRVGLDYKITENTLIYANVSRGYKAGSFPSLAAATFKALKPVTQESVTAYEAGFKTQFLDRVISLNAAAFYYDYRDKQIRGKIIDNPNIFGALDTLANIPKSTIYGFEADLTIRPTRGLSINGALTYLNSEIKTGPVAPYNFDVFGRTDSFVGDNLPFTPKWSGVINADYRHEMSGGGSAYVGVTTNIRSSSDAVPGGSRIGFPSQTAEPNSRLRAGIANPFQNNGYATVDARLGYEGLDGAWRIMIWGKNVFDKYYWTNVIASADSVARFAGRPATYGITVGFKIN